MNTEPVVTIAAVASAVGAVITALVSLGVEITEDQKVAALGLVATFGPLIAAYFQRRKVTPAP